MNPPPTVLVVNNSVGHEIRGQLKGCAHFNIFSEIGVRQAQVRIGREQAKTVVGGCPGYSKLVRPGAIVYEPGEGSDLVRLKTLVHRLPCLQGKLSQRRFCQTLRMSRRTYCQGKNITAGFLWR